MDTAKKKVLYWLPFCFSMETFWFSSFLQFFSLNISLFTFHCLWVPKGDPKYAGKQDSTVVIKRGTRIMPYTTKIVDAAAHPQLEMTMLKIFSDMPARRLVCQNPVSLLPVILQIEVWFMLMTAVCTVCVAMYGFTKCSLKVYMDHVSFTKSMLLNLSEICTYSVSAMFLNGNYSLLRILAIHGAKTTNN